MSRLKYTPLRSGLDTLHSLDSIQQDRKDFQVKTISAIVLIFDGPQNIHAAIVNEPYMRLVIEDIGIGPRGFRAVSVAHYFELNGDLCQDPEIGLEIVSQPDGTSRYEPFFFQVAIPPIYQEVYPDGPNSENRVLKQKLTEFLHTWEQNLADQGFLKAARKAVVNRADRPGA